LTSIINQDPVTLNQGLNDLDDLYPDYRSLLDNMASILQQVAFLQITGNNQLNREQEIDKAVINFAKEIQPEVIQLLYQITITSKRDIELAPSQREGFSMAILRMYAFTASADEQSSGTQTVKTRVKKKEAPETLMKTSIPNESELDMEQNELQLNAKNWLEEIKKLNLSGALRQLASHCSFKSIKKNTLYLTIDSDHSHLLSNQLNKKFNELLINHFTSVSNINIEPEPESGPTLAKKKSTKHEEQLIMNESRSRSDPIIEKVKDLFGATLKN
jgi:DNA polymerase-3 subunit gamma/tau